MSANTSAIYLYVIPKAKLKNYTSAPMPAHYKGTIRDESKMGYTLLKDILRARFGTAYDAKSIRVTSGGKPFIAGSVLRFNISYSRDYIACAVGYQELGVDIEQERPNKPELLEKILTTEEIKKSVDPLQAWVVKEAYSKFLGVGLGLGFTSVAAKDLLDKSPSEVLSGQPYYCTLFYANPDAQIHTTSTLERASV